MRWEGPGSELPSLEELSPRIEKIYGLLRAQGAARWTVEKSSFTDVWGTKSPDEYDISTMGGGKKEARKSWEALEQIPEFRDFLAEEASMFAGGVSGEEIKQYSTLYRRAYAKRMEIEAELNALEKSDDKAYLIARSLERDNGGKPWSEVDPNTVKAGYDGLKKEKKEWEEFTEYLHIRHGLDEAAEGMKAKELLTIYEEEAKARGFGSAEEMWAADVDTVKKFRARVGDDRFRKLTGGMNSMYGEEERKLVEGE